MNKLFTKIVGAFLGLTMAVGVGVAVASSKQANSAAAATIDSMVTSNNFVSGSTVVIRKGNTDNYVSGIDGNWLRAANTATTALEFTMAGSASSGFTLYNATNGYIAMTSATKIAWNANSGYSFKMDTNGYFYYGSATSGGTYMQYNNSNNGARCYTAKTSGYETMFIYTVTAASTDPAADFDDSEITNVYSGETADVTFTYTNVTNVNLLSVESSDDSVVEITDGIDASNGSGSFPIEFVSDGSATITLYYDNEELATLDVTVNSGTRPLSGEITSFTSASGTVVSGIINYATEKGGGTSNPYVNNGKITLYQPASGQSRGGRLIITATDGYKIEEVTFQSSQATTVAYTVDSDPEVTGQSVSANTDYAIDGLTASSLVIACCGSDSSHRLVLSYLKVSYKTATIVLPTRAVATWSSGKGTYYNGGAKNTFNSGDLIVSTYNGDNLVKTYSSGTGFKVTINNNELDATSEAKTLSLEGYAATTYTVLVVVPGVGASGANVDNSAQNPACQLTVTAKTPASYEWTSAQTNIFYSHRDSFAIDGTLKVTFNDGSSTSSANNFNHTIRAYDGSAAHHAGSEVTLPTHTNGTLNVANETQYVLDIWHKDYSGGLHEYVEFTVKIPTLTVTDNYSGSYFVDVLRVLDFTVTATFESNNSRNLDSSEYTLSSSSVTPANTDPINITVSWIIDESVVMSAVKTINPVVSTRVLESLTILDQEYSAGSYFTLDSSEILLEGKVNNVDFDEYKEQSSVTFITEDDVILSSSTRLLKSYAGTITATYSEGSGVGKTVSCTFTLTVTDAVVESISSTTATVYEKITSTKDLEAGNYLVVNIGYEVAISTTQNNNNRASEGITFSGESIIGSSLSSDVQVLALSTNTISGKTGWELSTGSGYLYAASSGSNYLRTQTTNDANGIWAISFDEDGNANIVAQGSNSRNVLRYNVNNSIFSCYAEGKETVIQLFKASTQTIYTGDKVSYLKSVIDAYRLNSGTEGNVCNAQSGIYSSSDWSTAKAVYAGLSSSEITNLSVQDDFGEQGKTYIDTFEMLIENDPAKNSASKPFGLLSDDSSSNIVTIIIISMFGITGVGGYFFIKRRKEN